MHPKSLDLQNQKKVFRLRECHGMSWEDIAAAVKNRQGKPTSPQNAKNAYMSFIGRRSAVKKYNYKNCGRKAWKLTPAVQRFLLKTLVLSMSSSSSSFTFPSFSFSFSSFSFSSFSFSFACVPIFGVGIAPLWRHRAKKLCLRRISQQS